MQFEEETKQQDIKHLFEVQDLTQSVCNLNVDEDENTDSSDDNLDDQGYVKEKEGEHPFLTVCRKIHRRINGHQIDDLRKYMNSNGMKYTIMKLHDEYKNQILPMDNSNPVKQEVDCLMSYLGISYYDLTIPEGVN